MPQDFEATTDGMFPKLGAAAIERLPEDEREVFCLVRIQGLSHGEAAALLDVSTKTVQRRIHRSMLLLAQSSHDRVLEPWKGPEAEVSSQGRGACSVETGTSFSLDNEYLDIEISAPYTSADATDRTRGGNAGRGRERGAPLACALEGDARRRGARPQEHRVAADLRQRLRRARGAAPQGPAAGQ